MIEAALLCLALNIYHEARGEPTEGQLAVAAVTLNRAEHDPRKVCQVVFQPSQFSWTDSLPGTKPARKRRYAFQHLPGKNDPSWKKAQYLARYALSHKYKFPAKVVNYHTIHVLPAWATSSQFKLVTAIGDHLFYAKL